MSYEAVVCKLKNVRKHPNADKLNLTTIQGYQTIVGLDNTEDQLGVFFPAGGKLSEKHLYENNLYSDGSLNKDTKVSGYFNNKGRVRAQNFRGEASEGFWQPIECFDWVGSFDLEEGDVFSSINGHLICEKYITEATKNKINNQNKQKGKKLKVKHDYSMFHEHYNTGQVRHNIKKIPEDSLIYISEKLHGCVSGDTIVDTLEYGKMKIAQIVNKNLNIHIKGVDIQTGEQKFTYVSNKYLKKNHGEWYRITLEDGSVIEITGNNPIWLPELKCYRRVDKLALDDILLIDK